MINSIISHLIDSGAHFSYPEFRFSKLTEEGLLDPDPICFNAASNRKISIENNQFLKFSMMFTIFDIYVDSSFSNMSGCSFHKKYKKIPRDNDRDIIISQLFRVSKVIRNAIVHDSLSVKNNIADISYSFNGTKYVFKSSISGLNDLYSAIILCVDYNIIHGSEEYFYSMLRCIYDFFKSKVVEFQMSLVQV